MFRGMTKDGKLVYGYYIKYRGDHFILPKKAVTFLASFIKVDPESTSQFTGILDKNEKEIYGSIPIDGKMSRGGDCFRTSHKHGFCSDKVVRVEFVDGSFVALFEKFDEFDRIETLNDFSLHYADSFEVIGNQMEKE